MNRDFIAKCRDLATRIGGSVRIIPPKDRKKIKHFQFMKAKGFGYYFKRKNSRTITIMIPRHAVEVVAGNREKFIKKLSKLSEKERTEK